MMTLPAPDTDPKARLRDARDAVYRRAILEAAEAELADVGYDAAKVQDIAARAGVSLATLYKLYPGKADLRRAIHELRTADILERSTRQLPTDTDALGLLLHGVEAYVRFQLDHPAYLRLTLREGTAWSSRHSMTLPEQLAAWNAGVELALATFRAGIESGVFVDEPPEQHTRLMIAIQQVVLGEWVESGMRSPHEDVVQQVRRAIIRAFAADHARSKWLSGGKNG